MADPLDNPEYYINREFSALAFNKRILEKATDERIPLFERLHYLFIASSNLDEFFEIRVAGVKQQVGYKSQQLSIDGLTPSEILNEISQITHQLSKKLYEIYNKELIPGLENENILILDPKKCNPKVKTYLEDYFINKILPVVSPIGLDLARPFPRLVNKSLNFLVSLSGDDAFGRHIKYAVTHAPRSLSRVIPIPSELVKDTTCFVYLSTIIQDHIHHLFPGMTIAGCYPFRLTRNSDLFLREEEIDDLVSALKSELFARNYGDVVRLEIDSACPDPMVKFLLKEHKLTENDAYLCDGPVNLHRYLDVLDQLDKPNLCFKSFNPTKPQNLKSEKSILDAVNKKDIVLHHPYESFQTIVDMIREAAKDPDVLAIKQTLYRTHSKSAIVNALVEAARAGKEVTAVIELRARFDEESNIMLADRLNQAGALVLYGVVGFKTHAKMTLIVKRNNGGVKNYVHLGTGNYHERTAKIYTDIGLLTSDKNITQDVQDIFHQLTGLGTEIALKKLAHAPFTFKGHILKMIDKAIQGKKNNQDSTLVFKVNGLTDKCIIKALYKASQAGVNIILFIRTLCSLRPGIEGVSDNIRVISIVGRFLEHHRIYYSKIGDKESLYCASADLMERNLYHRIETLFPIHDEDAFQKIKEDIIDNYTQDDQDAWVMKSDGSYERNQKGKYSAQQQLLKKYIPKFGNSQPSN